MTDALRHERAALALAALGEVTDPGDVGALIAVEEPAEGVVDLRFASLLPGYADWSWTVSTAHVEGGEPTVLEVELLPGDGALLAPPWVPWTERLAEWRRSHAEEAEAGDDLADDDDPDDDHDDELDEDDADLDEDVDDRDGDIDGVDVDALVQDDDHADDDDEDDHDGDDRS